jgi:hypothetical protein
LRQYVARSIGGSFPPHEDKEKFPDPESWYYETEIVDIKKERPGLFLFLAHSDCSGKFSPEEAKQVADDLEWLCEKAENELASGHLIRTGDRTMKGAVLRFAAGCRRAAEANEPLEFK